MPDSDWSDFALLLIDVQKAFYGPKTAANFPEFPDRIIQLLELCRSIGIEVVHIRSRFNPDMSNWMAKYKLRGSIPCIEGTEGAETLPFASDMPEEEVIYKQTFDGFFNPELNQYLRANGRRFLLTAGLTSTMCVLFTTASAVQRGFLCAVIEDCCCSAQGHVEALERLNALTLGTCRAEQVISNYSNWSKSLNQLDRLEYPSK